MNTSRLSARLLAAVVAVVALATLEGCVVRARPVARPPAKTVVVVR